MVYVKAFGIKLIIIGVITFAIFGVFYSASLESLILMSLLIAGIAFIGDLLVLLRVGDPTAVVLDFILYSLLYWGLGTLLISGWMIIVLGAFIAGFIAAISEFKYHNYLLAKVFKTKQDPRFPIEPQVEMAEEIDAQSINKNQKNRQK